MRGPGGGRRDAPGWEFYAVALLLLLVPPAFASLRWARPSLLALHGGAERPPR